MKRWILALLFLLLLMGTALAEATDMTETVLYTGQTSITGSWQQAVTVNAAGVGGAFDTACIVPGGYFTVEYTGVSRGVYLALSDWESNTWASVNVADECTLSQGVYTATFTFEQCYIQYGHLDFSDVDQICVGTTASSGTTVVQKVAWHSPVQSAESVLFSGEASSSDNNTHLAFCFTRHVGGYFDAAKINQNSAFHVTYTGQRNGVYLALSSHSGAKQWARVDAAETQELGEGRYLAVFPYSAFSRAWGTNFARLDQVSVYSSTAKPVTVTSLTYVPGKGEAVDTSDGRWTRPDGGIAFIGDSICQNALLIYGDWNAILNRSDCANYGIGGQTSVECRARINELASRNYRQVVFICGINDIGRGYTKEEIVANYDAMISAIRETSPDCQFLILSTLPTTSAFYAGQQSKITLLNLAFKRYASRHAGVTYVDAYSSFTAKTGEYAYPELLSDGLHPNREGYAKIAEILAPYLVPEE